MSEATHRPTDPAHPTRQQLDELEALMQRMLELQRGTVLLTLASAQGGLFDEVPPPQAS
jgi:hypothetical protein